MMNKKKKTVIIAISTVFACALIVGICVFAVGKKQEKSIRKQVDELLTVTSDFYLEDEENSEEEDVGATILTSILKNVKYEIVKISSDSCTLKITSPDVYQLYSKVMAENPIEMFATYDEYQNAVSARLEQIFNEVKKENYEFKTSTVEVAIKDGNIETTNEFADAVYGGLISLQEELIEKYIQEETGNE